MKTRQASPECTQPIRGLESQTSYPRVCINRQAIPEFNGRIPYIKGRLQNPRREKKQAREKPERGEHKVKEQEQEHRTTHAAGS